MSVFVMADPHLSLSTDKPMDKFGARWTDHAEKIRTRWCEVVAPEDTVVIPGDLSWGINLEQALPDLSFIDALPGKKILLKGNHDYWWDTVKKMTAFFDAHGITTMSFLHNNAVRCENFILCGSRGWYTGDKKVVTANEVDAAKLIAREVGRLRTSLEGEVACVSRSWRRRALPWKCSFSSIFRRISEAISATRSFWSCTALVLSAVISATSMGCTTCR
ncbi:MAG: metallophosphoesterase [Clostridia bacterium]|nr:metallophosphoesterase [Clostridia bacterium]